MKKFLRNFYPFQQNLFNTRKSISLLNNMYRYRRKKFIKLQNPLPRFPTLFNDKLLNPKNNNLLNLNINFGMQQKSYFSTSNIHSSSTSSSSSTTGRNDDTYNEYENFLVLKKLLQSKRVSLSFISLSELLMKAHGMKIPTKYPSNRYDIKNPAFKNNQLVLANHNQEKENKQHQNVTNNISNGSDKHLRTKHLNGPFAHLYIPVVLVDDPEEIIVVHEDNQKIVNQTNQITELDSIQDDVELMTLEEIINFPEYRRSPINNIQELANHLKNLSSSCDTNQFHKQTNNKLDTANINPGDEMMNDTVNEDGKQLREFSILSQFDALIIAAAANAKNKIFPIRSRQLTSNIPPPPPVLIGSSPMSTKSKIEGTETEDVCSSGTLFQSYKAINAKNKISIIKQGICAEQPSQESKSEISAEKSASQGTKAMDDWKICGGKDSKSTTTTSTQKKEDHKTSITQTINAEKNNSSPCTAPKKQEKMNDAKAKEILKKEEKKDSKPCNSSISSSSTSKAKTDTQSPRSTCVKKEAKQTNDGKTDSKSVTVIEKEKSVDKKITCEKTKPEIKLTLDTCKIDKVDCSKILTEPKKEEKIKPAQSVSAYEKSNKNEGRVDCGSKKRVGTLKFCSEYEKTEKSSRHTKSFIIKVSDVNNNLTSVEVIPGESSEINKYSSYKSSDQRITLDGGTGTQKEVIIEIDPPAKVCIRSKQKVDGTKPPSIGSGTNNSKSGTKKCSCIPDSKLNNSKSKAGQMRYNTKKYSTLLNANYLATNTIPGFREMPPINYEYGSILYNIFNSSKNSSIFTSEQNFENLSAAQTANFIPTNLISSLLILAVTTFHKLNYRLKSIFKSKFASGNSHTFATTSVKDKIDCQTKTTIATATKCDDNAVNKMVTITGCRELKVIDCPIPKIGDYDVLIKVDTCGITGADLYMYQTNGENCKNIILGYEAAGIIEKAGKCVSHLQVGDHAVIEPGVCCGLCHFCKTGKYNLCLHTIYLGTMGTYAAYTGDFCHKLPKQINMEDGALVHPVALALHAIFKAKVCPKSRVLVIGSCPVALSSVACAKAMNASKVSIVDEIRNNLELAASKFGADHAILVQSQMTTDDMYKCILDQIKCHPNVVIITSGCSKAFSLASKCCDYGGTIILAGCHTQCASVNILQILNKEIKIDSSFRSRNTFPAAIDLINRGKVQPSNFIAHRIPFNNVKDAFETALDSCKESLKVVLKFQNTSSSSSGSIVSKTTDNLQKKS